MNHIYKVVWSKVKNCYVVVSEIAHNSGKEHSSRTSHSHRKGSQGGLYALALAIALGFIITAIVSKYWVYIKNRRAA